MVQNVSFPLSVELKACVSCGSLAQNRPSGLFSPRSSQLELDKMDVKHQSAIVQDEKSIAKHYEEDPVKPGVLENADYTGAEAKTDPAEIALVRKIDWRLMVRMPQKYHLNTYT
jgi:hypothetical protein